MRWPRDVSPIGLMRDVHVLLGGDVDTRGAFLRDGSLFLTAGPWVHFFASPRIPESVYWNAGAKVTALQRTRERDAAVCATYDGKVYRLWLEGDAIASEPLARDAAELLGDPPIGQRVGRRLFVRDQGNTYIVEPERARRARFLREWDDSVIDATDDGVTVVIAHEGNALIGDIDESKLEWDALPA